MDPSPPAAPRPPPEVVVRPLAPGDSFEAITDLLHRAYARLAALGFNYTAVDQGVEVTRRRASEGVCLVAERAGRLVGTLTVRLGRSPHPEDPPSYREDGAVILGQFAVEPALQGAGIGGALLDEAERVARARGARAILGDTSGGAGHLIAYYARRGWRVVDRVRWPGKTYESVVMRKALS